MGFEALCSVHRPHIPPDAAFLVTLEKGMLNGVEGRVRMGSSNAHLQEGSKRRDISLFMT